MSQYELQVHPEADLEYDRFVSADRSIAYDVGSHFRILESIVSEGLPEGKRAVHREHGCSLYNFYGTALQMFLGCRAKSLVLLQLSAIGGEHEGAQAVEQARERMRDFFEL